MFKHTRIKLFIVLVLVFAFAFTANAQSRSPLQPDGNQGRILAYSDYGSTFVHVATAENISGWITTIDHPLLNGNPEAALFATSYFSPGFNATFSNFGVWYNGANWTIFNQDLAAMPIGAGFMVQILSKSESVVQVALDSAPEVGDVGYKIDHPLANNNPLAMIHVTPTWTVDGADTGVYYDNLVVLDYVIISGEGGWYIYDTDYAEVPDGAGFNIQITNTASRDVSFIHEATAENTTDYYTIVSHPLLDSNPDATFLVTQIYNLYESGGNQTGVPFTFDYCCTAQYYLALRDFSNLPVGTQFLVTIIDSADFDTANTVQNAGFEVAAPDGSPSAWNVKGIAAQKCNNGQKGKVFAYEQYCAGQIKGGNGAKSAFVQSIADVSTLTSGNNVYLGARVFGKNNAGPVKAMVKMTLADASVVKVKVPGADLKGSFFYKPVSASTDATLTADVTSAKVKIQHKGTGKLIVDAVYLSNVNMTYVAVEAPDTLPLPLPAAPDAN